jgi:hypothetical protein
MFDCKDNQDVGLEAATIQRVRNSSLVKWSGADNVTGLKHGTEATDFERFRPFGVVGERSQGCEAAAEACRGTLGSENAGTSNERRVRNSPAECPRVPE